MVPIWVEKITVPIKIKIERFKCMACGLILNLEGVMLIIF
jgi:hypothetical protein